jgi:hypothetical protein
MRGRKGVHRIEAHAAAQGDVDAQAAHPCFVKLREFGIRHVACADRDTAQSLAVALEHVDHQPIVGAVDAGLDEDATVQAEPVQHRQILGFRRFGCGVAPFRL